MTRKLPVLLFLPLFLFVFVATANAITDTVTTESAKTVVTTESTTATSSAASKLKQQAEILREQKRAAVAKIKDARDEIKAQITARKEEFKAKVETIKDLRKKALIEKIDVKLANLNVKQTAKFTDALTRIQGFLDKVRQSATDTKVLADILVAQNAIDSAKTVLETQADKSYTMEITDEATLKANAGTIVSQLRQDLSSVHKLVVAAKQAVQKVVSEKSGKANIEKEATDSATQSYIIK